MTGIVPQKTKTTTARPHEPPSGKVDRYSFIDLDLAARGVAQVIVFLKRQPPAALGVAAAVPAAPADVRSCFTEAPTSHNAALRRQRDFAGGGAAAANVTMRVRKGKAIDAQVRHFRNLGIMLGNVDRDGLAALEGHDGVEKVMAAPPLRLIHPQLVAPATPPKSVPWGIKQLAVKALWSQGFDGSGVLVGHLDTGIDGKHPAIKPALDRFAQFDDLGAIVDPAPKAFDSGEHGTHTAGTIAGRAVKGAVIGVAPGAALASAMVIEGGNVVARVLGGLDWAIDQNVRIISMSLGFQGFHTFFSDVFAILRENEILPVIAVGNEKAGTSRSPGNYVESLSVGAMDKNGSIAEFSSSQRFVRDDNPLVPDIVAPGVEIISAKPGKGYQLMSGSSMATPHVAGLAAVLMSAFPTATADQVETAIFDSSTRTPLMDIERANRGVPDAVKAFDLLKDAVA